MRFGMGSAEFESQEREYREEVGWPSVNVSNYQGTEWIVQWCGSWWVKVVVVEEEGCEWIQGKVRI